ncbi:MAG: GNAT family N-acetyltransferase [Gemmatimonadota bacterium]|nr:MAG: GNAT family N-acetyltransferase [Gemmatimonadota bacterium]
MTGDRAAAKGIVRCARPDEATALSALAFRSKVHWGYDREFMEACREALTLTVEFISGSDVYVMEVEGQVVGFYTIAPWNWGLELTHFFVDPSAMGNGLGRRLWDDAVQRAAALGHSQLLIQSDPFAEGFYLRLGAERIGEVPSEAQPGRMLPLLVFPLQEVAE